MLSVLVLALEVMNVEAQPLGMSINWTKTKIQDLGGCDAPCQRVIVQGNEVEVVESFIYLGSLIHCSGGSELEIKRRATIVRESMFALEQNIWRSSITLEPSSGYTMFAFFRYFCRFRGMVCDLHAVEEDRRSERRIFCGTECVSAVQGHPRSLILAPIERAYATSY